MSSTSPITDLGDIDSLYNRVPYVGFLLNKVSLLTVQQVNVGLKPLGIRIQHYISLLLLSQMESSLPQKEIGTLLRIDRNTVVSIIDELDKLALVTRSRDPHDRRAYAISISDKGREIVSQAGKLVAQVDNNLVKVLTAEELEQLTQILLKLLR